MCWEIQDLLSVLWGGFMIEYGELRKISLEFRRISSNFLCSKNDTASTQIQRFKTYIDTTPFISELIQSKIDNVDFDYTNCFISRAHGGWSAVSPPVDEACHIKAMYDYLGTIVQNGSNVFGAAMSYYHSSKKFDEIIQSFLSSAFKPIIDFINDGISKEMMIMEPVDSGKITQNIGNNYGSVSAAGRDVHSSNITSINNTASKELVELVDKLLSSIADIDMASTEKEDIIDDLETVREQVTSTEPKKSKLRKALSSISGFVEKVGVSLAVKGITTIDWQELIGKLTEFVSSL